MEMGKMLNPHSCTHLVFTCWAMPIRHWIQHAISETNRRLTSLVWHWPTTQNNFSTKQVWWRSLPWHRSFTTMMIHDKPVNRVPVAIYCDVELALCHSTSRLPLNYLPTTKRCLLLQLRSCIHTIGNQHPHLHISHCFPDARCRGSVSFAYILDKLALSTI